jgi:hypothetical protein
MNLLQQLQQVAQESVVKGVDEWLSAIEHGIVILGAPAAVVGYFHNRNKDREEAENNRKARERETEVRKRESDARELATYDALDNKYLEFEELCLRYSSLDVFDVPDDRAITPTPLSPMQKKRELIAFTMLFSIFERAFYMYSKQTAAVQDDQWSGWNDFIAGYCERPNFQDAWKESGSTFKKDFQKYMQGKIDAAIKQAPQGARG